MARASYRRAVTMAALQATLSGAWIAARELTPARRRLARFGAVAAVSAIAYAVSPSSPAEEEPSPSGNLPSPSEELPSASGDGSGSPASSFGKREAALTVAVLGLSVAAIAGRRQWENRWLARLTRNGHAHPTRSLAVRMAAVEFAAQLALQLADLNKPDAPSRPESEAARDRDDA